MSGPSAVGSSRNVTDACFSVYAPADPSLMPRVLEVFAKRGLVPSQWHSTLCGGHREDLEIDVQLDAVDPAVAERIAALLRQVVGVDLVLTSEKCQAPAA